MEEGLYAAALLPSSAHLAGGRAPTRRKSTSDGGIPHLDAPRPAAYTVGTAAAKRGMVVRMPCRCGRKLHVGIFSLLLGLAPGTGHANKAAARVAEPFVILPASEPLIAEMVGEGGANFGGCTLQGAAIRGSAVDAVYRCKTGRVVLTLRHPSVPGHTLARTVQFAVVAQHGRAPPELVRALALSIRAQEAGFAWHQPAAADAARLAPPPPPTVAPSPPAPPPATAPPSAQAPHRPDAPSGCRADDRWEVALPQVEGDYHVVLRRLIADADGRKPRVSSSSGFGSLHLGRRTTGGGGSLRWAISWNELAIPTPGQQAGGVPTHVDEVGTYRQSANGLVELHLARQRTFIRGAFRQDGQVFIGVWLGRDARSPRPLGIITAIRKSQPRSEKRDSERVLATYGYALPLDVTPSQTCPDRVALQPSFAIGRVADAQGASSDAAQVNELTVRCPVRPDLRHVERQQVAVRSGSLRLEVMPDGRLVGAPTRGALSADGGIAVLADADPQEAGPLVGTSPASWLGFQLLPAPAGTVSLPDLKGAWAFVYQDDSWFGAASMMPRFAATLARVNVHEDGSLCVRSVQLGPDSLDTQEVSAEMSSDRLAVRAMAFDRPGGAVPLQAAEIQVYNPGDHPRRTHVSFLMAADKRSFVLFTAAEEGGQPSRERGIGLGIRLDSVD